MMQTEHFHSFFFTQSTMWKVLFRLHLLENLLTHNSLYGDGEVDDGKQSEGWHVTEVTRWIWTCDAVVKPCESPTTTAAGWLTDNCFLSSPWHHVQLFLFDLIYYYVWFFLIGIIVQVQRVRVMWPGWLTHWHICGVWYKERWHSRCRMNWNWSLLQDFSVRQQT